MNHKRYLFAVSQTHVIIGIRGLIGTRAGNGVYLSATVAVHLSTD